MFLGQFTHTIDDKGRLTIPVRFRDQFPDGGYIMKGFDNNLIVINPTQFEQLGEQLKNTNFADTRQRELKRSLMSQIAEVEVDKLGRILLPGFLRNIMGLESEAVIVGVYNYFEIWKPETWAEYSAETEQKQRDEDRYNAIHLSLN